MRSSRRPRPGPRASQVVGVPVLPPAALTEWTNRVRARLARAHLAMAPPPVRVLEALFGLLDYAALVALVELGVPDRLRGPMSIKGLAEALDADVDSLDRLVRYASARGWARIDRRGRVRPTGMTRFLARDHEGGWRAWVEFMAGPEVVAAAEQLAVVVRRGGDGFSAANGATFFDWMTAHPVRGAAFDAAMSAGARMHGLALAKALDWSTERKVCDVGGGDGSLLGALLAREPHLSGVLLDLPHVVARVDRAVAAAGAIEVVAGDAFVSVPSGATTYLLVNVVHDWPDADAVRMLRRVATDAPDAARVVVVEGVRRPVPLDDIAQRTDLLMLLLAPGGRERSPAEMAALGSAAGLGLESATPLASGDVAHVFRKAARR